MSPHQYPPASPEVCPVCRERYDYARGVASEHALCFSLIAVRADLEWLRDVYRKTRIVGDEAAKLGKALADIERQWPPSDIIAVEALQSRVNALRLAAKKTLGG